MKMIDLILFMILKLIFFVELMPTTLDDVVLPLATLRARSFDWIERWPLLTVSPN